MEVLNAIIFISLFGLTACLFPSKSDLVFEPKEMAPTLQPSEGEVIDFNFIKSNILKPKCISCHGGMTDEEGMLEFVRPGHPEESKLFAIVESGEMPLGSSPLSTAELEMIRVFITNLKNVEAVNFDNFKSRILGPHCLSCHKRMGEEENLMKWISPEAPEQSKLYLRVHDGTMPKNGTPLSQEQQEYVLKFIKAYLKR